jgi:hypothetical protein
VLIYIGVKMAIVKVEPDKLQQDYDGFELYYDKQRRCVLSSPKGLARWLECDPKTVKRVLGTINVGSEAEIHTEQGLCFFVDCLLSIFPQVRFNCHPSCYLSIAKGF